MVRVELAAHTKVYPRIVFDLGHDLAVVNVGIEAHVDDEVAQKGDLLALLHLLHRLEHRVGVGGELVALGDGGDLALAHVFAQLVPEAELHVHRPVGVGAGDGGVGGDA